MDFFAHQDAARRHTGRLVLLFVLAVVAIVVAVDLVAAFAYMIVAEQPAVPRSLYLVAAIVTLAIIGIGTLVETLGIAGGGAAVARRLGARQLPMSTTDAAERRLVNVVEEMAIASGTAVPLIFVMDGETGINAFAAGFSPNDAAITVTRGALDALSRDELQGVIGHEFSHILNGDMRLNLRLMGVLGGILALTIIGRTLWDVASRFEKSGFPFAMLGVTLIAIGYIGVFFGRLIKAGVSRQREFLADASSVQFTRNPDGIGGALTRIAQSATGALVTHPHAEKASHMFFGEALASKFSDLMASHPPIDERLQKIYGRKLERSEIVARAAVPAAPTEMASGFVGAGGRHPGAQRAADVGAKREVSTHAATVTGTVGTVSTRQMDYAVALLGALPRDVRDESSTAPGAMLAMYGLVLALDGPVKTAQAQILSTAGVDSDAAFAAAARLQVLEKKMRLPLVMLAIPVLKPLPEAERLLFLAVLQQLIEADRRVTLDEFVLSSLLCAALGARAGRAVPIKYSSLGQLAEEARLALSLVAHAARRSSAAAFAQGVKELGLAPAPTLLDADSLNNERVAAALGRLNQLAPLQKPRLVKAFVQAALADGKLSLAEAELLRAICATLDCPLPPFVEAMDYALSF